MSRNFDGVDDYVAAESSVALGDARTIAFWFDCNAIHSSGTTILMHHGPGAGVGRGRIDFNNAKNLYFICWSANNTYYSWNTPPFATITGWKFLCVVFNSLGGAYSQVPIIYKAEDGGPLEMPTLTLGGNKNQETQYADGTLLYLGTQYLGGYWHYGRIGEFAAWANTLLTANQVAALYNLGMLSGPTPTIYWPFDSGALQSLGSIPFTTVTGTLSGANPPIRPAGRRG